ncbi:hypothetical protein GQ602_000218 [Ophiocordyceps camponoti-floridani]|uniref:Hydrophobin n=1 Tax=Ophiocordyceps camponoti-floridani TaxID=2030778 RepID=A0A8H4QBN7_9HYPO|nr:hypothetical protein GQ602_000218 [Ophiocordyceps camponoti-floridani]
MKLLVMAALALTAVGAVPDVRLPKPLACRKFSNSTAYINATTSSTTALVNATLQITPTERNRPLSSSPSSANAGLMSEPRFENSTRDGQGMRPNRRYGYKACGNSTFLSAVPYCCSFGPVAADCKPATEEPTSSGGFISMCQPQGQPKCCFKSFSGVLMCLGYVDR